MYLRKNVTIAVSLPTIIKAILMIEFIVMNVLKKWGCIKMWVLSKNKEIITNGSKKFYIDSGCIGSCNIFAGDISIGRYKTKEDAMEQFNKIVNEIRLRFGVLELD